MSKNKFIRIPSDVFPKGVCELHVGYRRTSDTRIKMTCAEDIVDFLREHVYKQMDLEYCESFYVLMLDRANKLFAWKQISVGGLSGTVADPRLIFETALLSHCTSIVLCHNHPSGNILPSAADVQLTKNICEGGKLLEITVLDHIILTVDGFYSFANEGLI